MIGLDILANNIVIYTQNYIGRNEHVHICSITIADMYIYVGTMYI